MMTYTWVVIRLLLFTVPVVATVYTYWTRTPQYALLHALTTEPSIQPVACVERGQDQNGLCSLAA
jgi:hypothetical protein